MCFLVCVDGVRSLPEGSGASRPTERARKSKRLQEPDDNGSCSLPAVTSRAHHSFGEVGNCHNYLFCNIYNEWTAVFVVHRTFGIVIQLCSGPL